MPPSQVGSYVGLIVGVLVGVLLLVTIGVFVLYRYLRRKEDEEYHNYREAAVGDTSDLTRVHSLRAPRSVRNIAASSEPK